MYGLRVAVYSALCGVSFVGVVFASLFGVLCIGWFSRMLGVS